ncbi:MAG: molybdate ABC transporter permease subunit [Halobacteriales archaeon]
MSYPRPATIRRWPGVAALLGGVLLLYYAVPIGSLLVAQSPAAVLARLGDPGVLAAATTSIVSASLSTGLAVLLGVPLAYWLARTEWRGAGALTALVVMPLVLPPVVSGLLLLSVVGPEAPLGSMAQGVGVRLWRSLAGVVLAQTFVASPFVVLTSKAAFDGVDRELEDAARTLGEGQFSTFRRVTLPLAMPGVLAGVTLAFARAMGEFGATLTLAYYPRTMPVEVWVAFSTRGLDAAYPVALVLLAVAVLALAGLSALGRLGSIPPR